jgi:enoyl-CoA hydratase/carnithine racemase
LRSRARISLGAFWLSGGKDGFVPAMVLAILRRNVSEKRAFELITLGEEISSAEAHELGLVNRVFDDLTFDEEVANYCSEVRESEQVGGVSYQSLFSIRWMDLHL